MPTRYTPGSLSLEFWGIALDSPEWRDMQHAYGSAADIPGLLRAVESFPAQEEFDSEPWFTLWSSLYHKGHVYDASFAAVPHIVRVLSTAPQRASFDFFLLPACIEVGRIANEAVVPERLHDAYQEALVQLPQLAADAAHRGWDAETCMAAMAATAAATGQHLLAQLLIEMSEDDIQFALESLHNR